MKESHIQKQILDYLSLRRIFHYRNNSGAFKSEYTKKNGEKKTGYVQYGAVGSPDIVCVFKGQYVGIEVKGQDAKGKWGVQSADQKAFQDNLEAAGGKYILAMSVEDVIKNLK
jgi:hypothetical protein